LYFGICGLRFFGFGFMDRHNSKPENLVRAGTGRD